MGHSPFVLVHACTDMLQKLIQLTLCLSAWAVEEIKLVPELNQAQKDGYIKFSQNRQLANIYLAFGVSHPDFKAWHTIFSTAAVHFKKLQINFVYLNSDNPKDYRIIAHQLAVKKGAPPRVIFMHLNMKEMSAPTLFDSEIKFDDPNCDGCADGYVKDIVQWLNDVLNSKLAGRGQNEFQEHYHDEL